MKTFAAKKQKLAPAAHKSHHNVHHPMGHAQQAQQLAMRKILRPDKVQAKPDINENDGKYEQQADRIANAVMRMPEPTLQRQPDEHPQTSISPIHNSPPSTGPGSKSSPLTAGAAVQQVARMRADAYYRSQVNPDNPVLVWTDGTNLFFTPSETQIAAGRSSPMPEPFFPPPGGYVAQEIHWDHREGLTTGGGPLVIIARQPGQPDLEVAVSNTLEQRSHFSSFGVTSGGSTHVTREGGEFVSADNTTVPLELSGAARPGAIHRVRFPTGFVRYRAPGGDHDLYVAQGADPFANLVERTTGNIRRTFAVGTINAIVPDVTGVVQLETSTPSTVSIDLRASPPTVTSAPGHASAESGYASTRARLVRFGVSIAERGVRFRVAEMEAVEQALTIGGDWGMTALENFRALEGGSASDPILDLTKSLGSSGAWGHTVTGGTPLLTIREPFEVSTVERTSTVRHEMTHVIMGAVDALTRARFTPQERANLEGALRYKARQARQMALAGRLRASEYGLGDRPPPAGSEAMWQSSIGSDPELAAIWVQLLRRYHFIPDPEGTGEFRGVSLADESRYSGAGDISSGHPADTAGEFVASFVTSATQFRTQFVAAVLAAEAAGNATGGRAGSYVRGLMGRAWRLIDSKYVSLGASPF
jgi:hypothetical protein